MSMSTQLSRALLLVLAAAGSSLAAERPNLNHYDPRDPRPDILPHPVYYAHTEYRRAYNRPRFVPGWIAAQIAPTSQEAMVWQENLLAGRYDGHHQPPLCKRYYYPKPWEVLQTGARPDLPPRRDPADGTLDFEATEPAPLLDPPGVPEPIRNVVPPSAY